MDKEKNSFSDRKILNEYVVADRKMYQNGRIDFILVPTYCTDMPEKLSIKCVDLDKFKSDAFWPGGLVTLTTDGKIKPVQYDMRKCDKMLVTGVYDATETVRTLTLMGKKFGLVSMHLSKEFAQLWEQKFFDTKRGDIVLVHPQRGYPNNEYEILRNFTTEKMITAFFESQRKR